METRFQEYNRTHAAKRLAYEETVRRGRRHIDRERMRRIRDKVKKRFIAWDGEGSHVEDGEPQPYMLFGNSDGQYVKGRQLQTAQCLNLILRSPKDAIHFGFAFGYDVNQILTDLDYRALWVLKEKNNVVWNGYHLQYIPGKWFQVRRVLKDERITRKIYDVFHFFNRALVDVLDEYKMGTEEERKFLREQKENRPDFTYEEIQEVIRYWKLEGRLMVELMTQFREWVNDAGFRPTSWHGPGAVARSMLKQRKVKLAKLDTRELCPEVWMAARYGFSGGRFQQWLAGFYDGEVYNYDIHSAYPYAIQFLPNLATGKFSHNSRVDRSKISRDRFCIYHIKYDAYKYEGKDRSYFDKCRPRPLFRRLKDDAIFWPETVEGWYWSPEAELVKDDPAAEFIEAWEFKDDGTRPLAFIADVYKQRELAKSLGRAIEYGFKLAMNSAYGQFAQRAGWENQKPPGPPPFHQLEWAGYVTSMCKAMVHKVACYAYDMGGLITIDTDGIYSTVQIPDHILPNGIGDELGQWEEAKYQGMLIWQNGFYWLKKNGEWSKARSRGAPRGKVDIDAAWDALAALNLQNHKSPISYKKMQYIGFRQAMKQPGLKWRSWTPVPTEVAFGGKGKMYHCPSQCKACKPNLPFKWSHSMHNLHPKTAALGEYTGQYQKDWSYMHNLPWLDADENAVDIEEDEELMAIYKDVAL
jgi:hypothetical protein